ncbi:putative acetate kinase [Cytospora mali]|uniref:Probable acetate kinase n=1 Tax=Cytospora mali TaxID=578113 RepID=A0A194UQZ8_CYTMA|nr:putative acetate kinase [Valsa mali var. pyri (nom. inval.)]
MTKIILSVNAGSSSVKVSVFTADVYENPTQIAEAQISGLTSPPPKLTYTRGGTTVSKNADVGGEVHEQNDAWRTILKTLIDDASLPQIGREEDIAIVCHRIVHGGNFRTAQVINEATYHRLEKLNDLAPLHNAPSLEIVKSCVDQLTGAVNVACFDTQFHASMPLHVRTYPIDQDIARKNGLRKYGFHGISYSFITRSVAQFLKKDPRQVNIIALHLGSGASACAIKEGRSWDTSMGLTPLAGLPGATRSGSIDPSLVFHYASDVGRLSPASTKELHISVAETVLNKESGWKALTGTTNFGVIADPASADPSHQLAFDLFVDRVCSYVGSYYVSLRGQVDALVFAGGIGERSDRLRKTVVESCACLGFAIDDARNSAPGDVGDGVVRDISSSSSSSTRGHRVLVCTTDEQFEMARGAAEDPALWVEDGDDTPDLTLLRVKSHGGDAH